MNELALFENMRELALFAGAGGGILGGHLLGWRTVCAVEIEDYPRRVLLQRQADGILPRFPIWDDVCTFDGKPWRGKVDVISGGFPCQDISAAGNGAGLAGSRSGLWSEMARIIGEVRPTFVWVENSPMLTSRGLGTVLGDMASLGYDAEYGVLGAHHAGAPHKRDRIWILAYSNEMGCNERAYKPREERETLRRDLSSIGSNALDNANMSGRGQGDEAMERRFPEQFNRASVQWWDRDPADMADGKELFRDGRDDKPEREVPEPRDSSGTEGRNGAAQSFVGRVAYGVANRMDRLKALGNGQVPAVAALAWRTLYARIPGNADRVAELAGSTRDFNR